MDDLENPIGEPQMVVQADGSELEVQKYAAVAETQAGRQADRQPERERERERERDRKTNRQKHSNIFEYPG